MSGKAFVAQARTHIKVHRKSQRHRAVFWYTNAHTQIINLKKKHAQRAWPHKVYISKA